MNFRPSISSICAVSALIGFMPVPLCAQVAHVASRWEVGVAPALQLIPEKLAGEHVWSAGMQVAIARSVQRMLRVEVGVLGAFAPQLNYRDHATLNSVAMSASAELRVPRANRWEPYVAAGLGLQRFVYEDAPVPLESTTRYNFARAALGIRLPVSSRVRWRSEVSRQFGTRGAMLTVTSGASLSIARTGVRQ